MALKQSLIAKIDNNELAFQNSKDKYILHLL